MDGIITGWVGTRRGSVAGRLPLLFVTALGLAACGNSENAAPGQIAECTDASCSQGGSGGSSATGGNTTGGASGNSAGGAGTTAGETWLVALGLLPEMPETTPLNVCILYALEQYQRRFADCGDRWHISDGTLAASETCPDLTFAPGSTRTVDSTLACIDAWQNFPCDRADLDEVPPCASAGTRVGGEPCVVSAQCESAMCLDAYGTCGTCSNLVAPAGACDSNNTCPTGYACRSGTCVTVTDPEPGVLAQGEPCVDSTSCGEPNLCLGTLSDPTDRRCRPPPTAGDPCLALGIDGYFCPDKLQCNADAICVDAIEPGEPCGYTGPGNYSADLTSCGPRAYCDEAAPSEATCMPRVPLGAACPPSPTSLVQSTCEALLWCRCDDAACTAGSCASLRLEGQPCDEPNTVCHPTTECNGGVCVAKQRSGAYEELCGG